MWVIESFTGRIQMGLEGMVSKHRDRPTAAAARPIG